ncbi:MAG: hypothetical protein IJ240_02795 [Clostridia bacterium]|nr:hypothetical protein [Clostridia bacterium]
MGFVKCPRCELNYIEESEGYCKICKREMQGELSQDDVELCTICNERRVVPGKDVCYVCLKEMNAANDSASDLQDDDTGSGVSGNALGEVDPISSMDEIMPEISDDIPGSEYSEIENELSLDAMGEEESENDADEDEEDDN